MNARIFLLIAAGISAPAWAPGAVLAQGPCGGVPDSIRNFDRLHPERFVSVYEVTRDSQFIPIHLAQENDTTHRHGRSTSRVDINSKVHVTFARDWIARQRDYQTNVGITADLNGEPIAVPAYSEVGTQATSGIVNARGAGTAVSAICALERSDELSLSAKTARETILAAQRAVAGRNAVVDSVNMFTARFSQLQRRAEADSTFRARDSLAEVSATLRRLRSTSGYVAAVGNSARRAVGGLATDLDVVYPAILTLSQADSMVMDLVALRVGMPRAQINFVTQNVLKHKATIDSLNAVSTTDAAWLTQAEATIDRLVVETQLLDDVASRYVGFLKELGTERDPALLDQLRDTDLLISRTKAKVDDRILLTFTNAVPPGAPNPRQMTLDLKVRRFGWVSDITDSFLFLRRLNANYEASVPNQVVRAEQQLKQGTAARDTTIVMPLGVNFDLTPGASFIWTYYARGWSSSLAPSVGLNVSFPKFQQRTYTLSVAAGDNREVTRKESTSEKTFDIAVGPYVGFFDGAIGITAGRAITSERRPWYFGIGLSFLRLAKNAAKFFPTAQ